MTTTLKNKKQIIDESGAFVSWFVEYVYVDEAGTRSGSTIIELPESTTDDELRSFIVESYAPNV